MKENLRELFNTKEETLSIEEIVKKMGLKNTNMEVLRHLKSDLQILEKAGKVYYDVINNTYKTFPASFLIERVHSYKNKTISFYIDGKEINIESKNNNIHKNSLIVVEKENNKYKLIKVLEDIKNKKLNYPEEKIINALKPKEIHLNLNEIKEMYNEVTNEDLKELELSGDIYYDEDNFVYTRMPEHFFVSKAEVTKRGLFLVDYNGNKLNVPDNISEDLFPYDLVVMEYIDKNLKLIKILKRANPNIVFEYIDDKHIKAVGSNILVKCDNLKLIPGTRFLGTLGSKKQQGYYNVEFKEILSYKNDLDSELEAIGINNGFTVRYSNEELEQVKNIKKEVTAEDLVDRLDLTNETIFTIDGIHTKDMDDAIGLKTLPNGNYLLTVAIADVAHYIPYKSPLWNRAVNNTTSLYLVDSVSHMLHPEVSNGICSLNPNVLRLCKAYLIEIDSKGNIIDFNYENAYIKSKMKMNYDSVNEILENNNIPSGYEPYVNDLIKMNELAHIIDERRKRNGAIDFDSKEINFELDNNKNITNITTISQKSAEKLIENFMIITNEGMAEYMLNLGIDFVYRNHEIPFDDKVQNTIDIINKLGYHIDSIKNIDDPHVIQRIIATLSTKEEFFILSSLLLRSMQKAYFSTTNKGHFGLALKAYSQTTSPIRRLMDLVIEYILDNLEIMYYDDEFIKELKSLCERASFMERCADKAEYEASKLYMVDYCINNKDLIYEGYIQNITSKYIVVKTKDLIEGIVYLSDLDDGYYTYNSDSKWLENTHTKKKIMIGNKLELSLKSADREYRVLRFYGNTNIMTLTRKKD